MRISSAFNRWFAAILSLFVLLPIASAGLITSSGPRLFITSGGGGSDFPAQSSGGAVSMVPRSFGYGYDNVGGSGRDGATGRVSVVLVNDFTGSTVCNSVAGKTRMYEGSIHCCASTASPKVCIPTKEGIIDLDTTVRLGDYVDYYGQFAPGVGVIWKDTIPEVVKTYCSAVATQQRYWMGDFRPGDEWPGIETQNRDAVTAGGCADTSSPALSYIAFIGNFMGWSVDEILDAYSCGDNLAFHGNVFAEPLGKSIHDDQGTPDDGVGVEAHPYGPILGPQYRCDRVSWQRNVFAHIQSRHPFIAALRFAYANNIIYNPGDSDGSNGQGIRLSNDYSAASPNASAMSSNIVRNLFVKGPDSTTTFNAIVMDPLGSETATRQPSGSTGYIAGNASRGWTYANQLALRTGTYPGSFDAGAVVSAALPTGWETDLSGLLAIGTTTNPNDASDAEMLAFATTVCDHAGPRPTVTDSSNRARTICSQVLARISGTGSEGNVVNSVSGSSTHTGFPNTSLRFAPNTGGYPTPGSTTIDIFTGSGTCTGVGMPLNGTAIDDRILATGTFANGVSKVGYATHEAWAAEEYLCRDGQ